MKKKKKQDMTCITVISYIIAQYKSSCKNTRFCTNHYKNKTA
jgi:hypothetical protein